MQDDNKKLSDALTFSTGKTSAPSVIYLLLVLGAAINPPKLRKSSSVALQTLSKGNVNKSCLHK